MAQCKVRLIFLSMLFSSFNSSIFLCSASLSEDQIRSILEPLELAQKKFPEKYLMSDPRLSGLFAFNLEEEPSLSSKEESILNHFIRVGNNINVRDRTGKTALMYACRNLNPYFVKWLLDHGANPKIKNVIDGFDCLQIAHWITTCDPNHAHQGPCSDSCLLSLSQKRIARFQTVQKLLTDSLKKSIS